MKIRRRPHTRGVTLAEMMVALSILAVLASVTLFSINHHRAERDLDAARRQVLAMFDYARQASVAQGGCQMTFSPGAGFTCQVQQVAAPNATLSSYTAPSSVQVSLPAGVTTLVFAANGSLNNGGTVTFSSLSVSDTHTIVVNTATGGAVLGP